MDARRQRAILQRIAHPAMRDRGSLPDFSSEARAELYRIPDRPAAEIFPLFPGMLSTDLTSRGATAMIDRPSSSGHRIRVQLVHTDVEWG